MTDRLYFTESDEANTLIAKDPMALLVGFALDQQVTVQKAFSGPLAIKERVGSLSASALADADLEAVFREKPAVHRFPGSMATRVQQLCQALVADYDGRAENVWVDVSDGRELLRRVKALPGFGEQKAKIFLALLGKQYGVTPTGWREAAGAYGEDGSRRSVADVVDEKSLDAVRASKKAAKAAARGASS